MGEVTGEGWLFVPGHGPVTDVNGVLAVRRYFAHVDEAVGKQCTGLPVAAPELDEACAKRVLESLPQDLRQQFQEPQRIMICAVVDRMARRARGSAKIDVITKVKYIAKMFEIDVRNAFAMVDQRIARAEL